MNGARFDVGSLHGGEQDFGVLETPYQPADRREDVGRRQRRGRDLIEQRLEDMVIGAVDERDVDRRIAQLTRGVQPAEAATDDHHPWAHAETYAARLLRPSFSSGASQWQRET